MTFTNYITLIEEQRNQYPNQAKNHYFRYLAQYNFTAESMFNSLIAMPPQQTIYVNTIELEKTLYPDVDDFIYAEFVNISLFPSSSLNKWRYYYVPQSFFNNIVEGTSITFKEKYLPHQWYYNAVTSEVKKVYAEDPFLFKYRRPGSYSYINPTIEKLHPYSKSFIFTGVYFLNNNNGQYIYEYNDFKQFHDYIGIRYYSDIKPINFDVPKRSINITSFENEGADNSNIISIPNEQTWNLGEDYELFYNGEVSNTSLTKKRKYYVYSRSAIDINTTVTNSTLRLSPPFNTNYDFVKAALGGTMTLNLVNLPNSQSLSYNQTSTNNILKIGTDNS